MFFSKKRKVDEFSSLLSKSLLYTELGQFDDALKNYYILVDLAKKQNQEQKSDFLLYLNIMRLYLKTIDLKNLYINSNFREIKNCLEHIRYLMAQTKELTIKPLASLEYIQKHFEEYSRLYIYYFYLSLMTSKLKEVYTLLALGIGDAAKAKFTTLLRIYNKLVRYAGIHERDNIHRQLLKLSEEIELVMLKEKAYSKPSKTEINQRHFKIPLVEVEKREFIGTDTFFFNEKFSAMHKYLKRNNLDGALRLYNQT